MTDDGGIRCDETLQSSVEGIFAAGDVCSYDSQVHGRRLRVEHWDVAMQQGQHAARAMMGDARAVRGGALLLQRPGRLGRARVRGSGDGLGRGDLARRPRRRRVHRLLSQGRQGGGRPDRRALGGAGATRGRCWRRAWTSAARRRRRCWGTPTATSLSSHQARLPEGRVAGWCNWQHVRLWSANSGFKSLARSWRRLRSVPFGASGSRFRHPCYLARPYVAPARYLIVLVAAVGAGLALSACGGDSSPETPIVGPDRRPSRRPARPSSSLRPTRSAPRRTPRSSSSRQPDRARPRPTRSHSSARASSTRSSSSTRRADTNLDAVPEGDVGPGLRRPEDRPRRPAR